LATCDPAVDRIFAILPLTASWLPAILLWTVSWLSYQWLSLGYLRSCYKLSPGYSAIDRLLATRHPTFDCLLAILPLTVSWLPKILLCLLATLPLIVSWLPATHSGLSPGYSVIECIVATCNPTVSPGYPAIDCLLTTCNPTMGCLLATLPLAVSWLPPILLLLSPGYPLHMTVSWLVATLSWTVSKLSCQLSPGYPDIDYLLTILSLAVSFLSCHLLSPDYYTIYSLLGYLAIDCHTIFVGLLIMFNACSCMTMILRHRRSAISGSSSQTSKKIWVHTSWRMLPR